MFFTIQITRTGESCAKQIFDFDDIRSAKANHFYFLSSCYGNENIDYFMGEIVDEDGNVVMRESWYPPVAEPEDGAAAAE